MKSIILQEKELKIARSVLLAAYLEQKNWCDVDRIRTCNLRKFWIRPKSDALTIAPQHHFV